MTDHRCPDCGAPISPGAVVCPQCGFPIRPDVMPYQGRPGGGGGGGGTGTRTLILVAVAAVGLIMVVVIGILAAIAIPRFAQASARAREKNGEALLKWAYTAEQSYFAEHGRYTMDVSALTAPGRPEPTGAAQFTLEVSAASDRELCLEAVPTPAAGREVSALSMDVDGAIYRAAGCSGEPYDWASVSPPTGAGGAEGARQMMREVYEGIVAYHAENGAYPTELADVVTRVHDTPAAAEYTMGVIRREGGVCVVAVSRGAGTDILSVDQDGKLYDDATCTGTVLETFTAPAGGGGPAAPGADPSAVPESDSSAGEPARKREDKEFLPIERMP
jgi:Tfp pilus assembly protein PilE